MAYPPKGLIIALVTPFDEKRGIDWASLKTLVEHVLPHAGGLLVGEGLAGEGLSLSSQMRRELLQGAAEIVAGRKPLLLCPTAGDAEEGLATATEVARSLSAHAPQGEFFWVDMPLWYHSNRKLPQFYARWSGALFPLLLYNHPRLISRLNRSLKRTNIRTAVLKSLAQNEQIAGLIQTGELGRTIHYQRAVRARRDFRFYDGDEGSFLNGPSSSGVVSAGANLLPAEWAEIVAASLNPPEDPARNLLLLQQSWKLRELSQALARHPAQSLKYALHRLGIIARPGVLQEAPSPAAGEEKEIGIFLRDNFSLQSPP